jgi:asparagine synthase (glutamine-hydrolysing)
VIFGNRDRGGTFWRGIEDFPPGHYAWLDNSKEWRPHRYWSLPKSRWKSDDISFEEASTGLADVLSSSLELRMRADVDIAFELNGGMDSSALVGLAAGRLGKRLTTCTAEFSEAHSNEEPFARLVAQRYPDQIDYRVMKPSSDSFWKEASDFVWLQEEPFHAPNLHTNQVLRRGFKERGIDVVITGAAGDEMLAGYAADYLPSYLRYLLAERRLGRFALN